MATVRITEQIRQEVRLKIERLFNTRIDAKCRELNHLDVAMQVFKTRVDPKMLEKAKELNSDCDWVPTIDMIRVHISYASFDGTVREHTFDAPFDPPTPAPDIFHDYYANHEDNIVHPSLPCYQPCVDVLLEYDRLVEERDTLRNSIAQLLCECSTLRQVLERWPTALDFMSDKVRARHAERTDSKSKKVIAEVDDNTKLLLMKARMMNGV